MAATSKVTFMSLLKAFFVCFCVFVYTMRLAGSYLSDQGLNPDPQH